MISIENPEIMDSLWWKLFCLAFAQIIWWMCLQSSKRWKNSSSNLSSIHSQIVLVLWRRKRWYFDLKDSMAHPKTQYLIDMFAQLETKPNNAFGIKMIVRSRITGFRGRSNWTWLVSFLRLLINALTFNLRGSGGKSTAQWIKWLHWQPKLSKLWNWSWRNTSQTPMKPTTIPTQISTLKPLSKPHPQVLPKLNQ